jgi:acetyltransferase-like isoleucine patch superfamily enzyme
MKEMLELYDDFVFSNSLKKEVQIRNRFFNLTLFSVKFNRLMRKGSLFMNQNEALDGCSIGSFSYGQPKVVRFSSEATLTIGKFCSFAEDVKILLGADGGHRLDWVTTFPFIKLFKQFKHLSFPEAEKGNVVIGNDVWVGANVMILSGVTVGDGAVIGASSVVTHDVPPYAIVAGNPASIIRKRFNEQTIESLLRIKWWNWGLQRIIENMPLLMSDNLDSFITKNG